MVNDSDREQFTDLADLEGVKPLKTKVKKVELKKRTGTAAESLDERRKLAVTATEDADDPLNFSHLELVNPSDIVGYQRPGLATGVYRNLRLGKYDIEARLDLHKKTVAQARDAVLRFISDCQRMDIRTAIIVHGKGEHGDPPALLKSFTNRWLKAIPNVLAFHSAQARHGGVGAVYILIKKSESAKEQNRQKFRR